MSIAEDDLGVLVDEVLERANGVGPPREVAGIRRRSSAADVSDLDSKAIAAAAVVFTVRREKRLEDFGLGDENRRSAQRTGLVGVKPRVDTERVERVAAEGEEAELVVGLELREADGAIGGGGGAARRDGGEGEERKRLDERGVRILRRDAAARHSERVSGGGGGGGGGC